VHRLSRAPSNAANTLNEKYLAKRGLQEEFSPSINNIEV
jgi:hypothetical protein